MKPETLYAVAEITRSSTPYIFGLIGLTIILCGIFNSGRLSGDRFAYVMGAGGAFGGYAAGGFSPQNRQSPQTRVGHADQVDIDQSK
ncbi:MULTISPECIES: hypothetical protein [unclassified Microcoleus]|uniref:hypothetical protein n=1 Tax=unclassified Microcoleus TaxID=2642155 RepID=UPI002FD42BB6